MHNPAKFKVGDQVLVDEDVAVITEILSPADSDFDKTPRYAVKWVTNEWGTFDENELTLLPIENKNE